MLSQLHEATSYEERSQIRQMLRRIKRESGKVVGRPGKRGTSTYNRFAGASSQPTSTSSPKSYIVTETTEKTKSVRATSYVHTRERESEIGHLGECRHFVFTSSSKSTVLGIICSVLQDL